MNKDIYNQIINGEDTYKKIAKILASGKSVIINWTDEEYTALDLIFSFNTEQEEDNYLQRGLLSCDLFISVIGSGAFGFNIYNEHSNEYLTEKLNVSIPNGKLAELINNIQKYLVEEITDENI